jgi:hypothetical protein
LPVFDRHTYTDQTDFICALADGASQAAFSALWARLLVKAAVASGFPGPTWTELVTSAQQQWLAQLSRITLPGQTEEQLRQGALATILWFGLRFPNPNEKRVLHWQAIAIGNTCLFQIRKRSVVQMVPPMASVDFVKSPTLLSTNPGSTLGVDHPFHEGSWVPGDGFLLMTAALSAWFVREVERGNTPMLTLEEKFLFPKDRQAKFNAWVTELRTAGEIKNEDTSILWVGTDPKLTSKT